jgi:hypothetical protein
MAKKMISLESSDDLREKLRVEAFNRSLSISAVIRLLLEESLNKQKDEESIANE